MISEGLDLVGGAIEEFDRSAGDMGVVRMPPLTKKDIDTWLKAREATSLSPGWKTIGCGLA